MRKRKVKDGDQVWMWYERQRKGIHKFLKGARKWQIQLQSWEQSCAYTDEHTPQTRSRQKIIYRWYESQEHQVLFRQLFLTFVSESRNGATLLSNVLLKYLLSFLGNTLSYSWSWPFQNEIYVWCRLWHQRDLNSNPATVTHLLHNYLESNRSSFFSHPK